MIQILTHIYLMGSMVLFKIICEPPCTCTSNVVDISVKYKQVLPQFPHPSLSTYNPEFKWLKVMCSVGKPSQLTVKYL